MRVESAVHGDLVLDGTRCVQRQVFVLLNSVIRPLVRLSGVRQRDYWLVGSAFSAWIDAARRSYRNVSSARVNAIAARAMVRLNCDSNSARKSNADQARYSTLKIE